MGISELLEEAEVSWLTLGANRLSARSDMGPDEICRLMRRAGWRSARGHPRLLTRAGWRLSVRYSMASQQSALSFSKPRAQPVAAPTTRPRTADSAQRGAQLVQLRRALVKAGREFFARVLAARVWLKPQTRRGQRSDDARWHHRRIGPGVRGLFTARSRETACTALLSGRGQLVLQTVVGLRCRAPVIGAEFARAQEGVGLQPRGKRLLWPTARSIELEWSSSGHSYLKRRFSDEVIFRLFISSRERKRIFGKVSGAQLLRDAREALKWAVKNGDNVTP